MPNGVAAAIHLAQAPPVQVSNPRYMQDSMFSVTPPHASHRLVAAPILGHTQRTISGKRKEGPWRRRCPNASPGVECLFEGVECLKVFDIMSGPDRLWGPGFPPNFFENS